MPSYGLKRPVKGVSSINCNLSASPGIAPEKSNKRRDDMARIVAVSTSKEKGVKKEVIPEGVLRENHGLVGDAHATPSTQRQVSLLATESVERMRSPGIDLEPGDFAENLTCEGIDLVSLPVGTQLAIGNEVVLEITQIGKECHDRCAIYEQVGDCVMPREGVFAIVTRAGDVASGDGVEVRSRGAGSYERTDAGGA